MQSILSNQPVAVLDKCYSTEPFNPIVDVDRSGYGNHYISKRMMYMDSNNVPFELVMNNAEAFNDYTGNYYAINKNCETCGRLYYDLPMLGIPISMRDQRVGSKNMLVISMEGVFHSFECAYIALMTIKKSCMNTSELNPVYLESETILGTLYSLCYPNETVSLKDAIKTKLVSEYKSPPSKLPNIIIMPLKTCDILKKESIC